MTVAYIDQSSPFGYARKYIVDADSAEDAIKQLQAVVRENQVGKVNKLARELYGDRLYELSEESLQKIIDENHGSGQTTAKALSYIVEAIQNPGKEIRTLHDHGDFGRNNIEMLLRVKELVEKLELKYLVFCHAAPSVRYDI